MSRQGRSRGRSKGTADDACVSIRHLFSVHLVHDDNKDGNFELEMTWIGPETNGFHVHVPEDLLVEAEAAARRALEEDMDED